MRRGNHRMKASLLLALCCVLASTGCVTSSPFGLAAPDAPGEPAAMPPRPAAPVAQQPAPRIEAPVQGTAPALGSQAAAPPQPDSPPPDAVIKINPDSDRLSHEMEARLAGIARQANADERLMLRLESYVPEGGSPSLNLGRAEQSLQLIRKRLLELNVSPRRIFMAPFGGEYATLRDERRHWVEIYLIRPRL